MIVWLKIERMSSTFLRVYCVESESSSILCAIFFLFLLNFCFCSASRWMWINKARQGKFFTSSSSSLDSEQQINFLSNSLKICHASFCKLMNHVCIVVLMKLFGMRCGGKINPHCHLRRLENICSCYWMTMMKTKARDGVEYFFFILPSFLNKLIFTIFISTNFWLLCSQNHSLSILCISFNLLSVSINRLLCSTFGTRGDFPYTFIYEIQTTKAHQTDNIKDSSKFKKYFFSCNFCFWPKKQIRNCFTSEKTDRMKINEN